jgi:hypothetical protein
MDNLYAMNFNAQEWAKRNAKERDEFISNQIIEYIEKKYDSLYIYDKRTEMETVGDKYTIRIQLLCSPVKLIEDNDLKLTYAIDVYEVNEMMKQFKTDSPKRLFEILWSNPSKYSNKIQRLRKEG